LEKPVANAVVMYASLPVFDHKDVGGRTMPGAIAEKTRQLFRRYSLTWMAIQLLQQPHCCRIAELRIQRACSTENIDPNHIPDPLFFIW
jgi:hypothetical protein